MSIFLWSDPHFGHKNIIDYENRPFKNVYEMDKALIENYNSVVGKGDKVFCLGDFSFYPKEKTAEIVRQLRGELYLVLGNHDRGHSVTWFREAGFKKVYEYPVCVEGFWWLSHEPMYMSPNTPYVNIHGHLHSQKYAEDNPWFGKLATHNINACVELYNYAPVSLDAIQSKITPE